VKEIVTQNNAKSRTVALFNGFGINFGDVFSSQKWISAALIFAETTTNLAEFINCFSRVIGKYNFPK